MFRVGVLVASLLLTAPPGATPPPGGSGPASGDLAGHWELRFTGLPAGFPDRLVMRLTQEQTRVTGEVLEPPSPAAFVTGKLLGRYAMVEVRPVVTRSATASYTFQVSLDPTSSRGLGTVRASLQERTRRRAATGHLEMTRQEGSMPGGP